MIKDIIIHISAGPHAVADALVPFLTCLANHLDRFDLLQSPLGNSKLFELALADLADVLYHSSFHPPSW